MFKALHISACNVFYIITGGHGPNWRAGVIFDVTATGLFSTVNCKSVFVAARMNVHGCKRALYSNTFYFCNVKKLEEFFSATRSVLQ